jgi:hypothetical protein
MELFLLVLAPPPSQVVYLESAEPRGHDLLENSANFFGKRIVVRILLLGLYVYYTFVIKFALQKGRAYIVEVVTRYFARIRSSPAQHVGQYYGHLPFRWTMVHPNTQILDR